MNCDFCSEAYNEFSASFLTDIKCTPQKEGDAPLQISVLSVLTWTKQDIFLWTHSSKWLNYIFGMVMEIKKKKKNHPAEKSSKENYSTNSQVSLIQNLKTKQEV